jgi:hypothetical protein
MVSTGILEALLMAYIRLEEVKNIRNLSEDRFFSLDLKLELPQHQYDILPQNLIVTNK